jgi:hypothetical protein
LGCPVVNRGSHGRCRGGGRGSSYEHAYDLMRAHGEAGWTGRLVPLVCSYELLTVIICSAPALAGPATGPGASGAPGDDLLQAQAAEAFAGEVAAGRVPSVPTIRAQLHVGQLRAQRERAYLTALINA